MRSGSNENLARLDARNETKGQFENVQVNGRLVMSELEKQARREILYNFLGRIGKREDAGEV